jgi:hypothetical protein
MVSLSSTSTKSLRVALKCGFADVMDFDLDLVPFQGTSLSTSNPGLKPWAVLLCHFMAFYDTALFAR